MNISTKMIAAIVTVLALHHSTPTVDAFLAPGGGRSGQIPFVGKTGMATKSPTTLMISLAPIVDPIKNLFKRGKKKTEELEEELHKKTVELVDKADKALVDFEDYLVESMKKKNEEITQEVAVEVVKLLSGGWDVGIAANKTETSKMMEGAMDNVTEDLISLGLTDKAEETKAALKESRLRWTTTWDASSYPLGIQNKIYMGNSEVITFYGQFQFDILNHTAVFSLDELIVFGVKVDLDSVIEQAEAESAEEAEDETDSETEEDETDADTEEDETDADTEEDESNTNAE